MFQSHVLAVDDFDAPVIEAINPLDGQIWVDPRSPIRVVLFDPEISPGVPGTGVDIASVKLYLDQVETPFEYVIDFYGYVTIKTPPAYLLPELSWISALMEAKDKTGNAMTPYKWRFFTDSYIDDDPPFVSSLSPRNGTVNVPCFAQISCKISDSQTGVDPESIEMFVNGNQVHVKIIEDESDFDVVYAPLMPFQYFCQINVTLWAADFLGNDTEISWSFQTERQIPRLYYPSDGALLNYQLEDGIIRFQWSYDSGDTYYRFKIILDESGIFEVFDLEPDDYDRSNSIASYQYAVSEAAWFDLSNFGSIRWQIAKINAVGGEFLTNFSNDNTFSLASPYSVVLRAPVDKSVFLFSDESPTFRWDPYDGVTSYVLGMIRIGTEGQLIGEIIRRDIESEITSFQFTAPEWLSLEKGKYLWTVVGFLPDGSYTDVINYLFEKRAFSLIHQVLDPL